MVYFLPLLLYLVAQSLDDFILRNLLVQILYRCFGQMYMDVVTGLVLHPFQVFLGNNNSFGPCFLGDLAQQILLFLLGW